MTANIAKSKTGSICERTKKMARNLFTPPSPPQLQPKPIGRLPTSGSRGPATASTKAGEARLVFSAPGSHQLNEPKHEPRPTPDVIDVVIEGKHPWSEIHDIDEKAKIYIREQRKKLGLIR